MMWEARHVAAAEDATTFDFTLRQQTGPKVVDGSRFDVGAGFKPALGPQTRTIRRGYYEHLIRNQKALDLIRAYIASNPARWSGAPENISRTDFNKPGRV
jgi:hypothetical protein